jgi:hypothetical protein
MRNNRTFNFLVILALAFFTAASTGYAGSGGGGRGGGIGAGVGMGHGIDLGSGGNSGIGLGHIGGIGVTHSITPAIATPGTSRLGSLPAPGLGTLPAASLGTSTGIGAPYSTGISGTGGKGVGRYDMTTLGKGVGLSYGGGIKPIDPGLDMTKIGRIGADTSPGVGRRNIGQQSTTDSLDRDVKDFDARLGLAATAGDQGVAGPQPPDRIGRRGTRNAGANGQPTLRQQEAAAAEQQAISQQELGQTLATLGITRPGSTAIVSPPTTTTTPPAAVAPDPSLSTALPASTTATDQTITGQIEDTSAPLSDTELTSLRGVFFPSGTPSAVATTPQSTLGVALGVGSTIPNDIALYPLPETAMPSAAAENLGYFFNGQSVVIADFNSRSIVGVVNNGS